MRLLFTILGLVFLVAGGFLLYQVFIVEPETTTTTEPTTNETYAEGEVVATSPRSNGISGFGATDGQGGGASVPGIERRNIEFEYPESFREGESGIVRVRLTEGQISISPEIEGNAVIPDSTFLFTRFDTHDGTVTATIEAPNFDVSSPSVTKPFIKGVDNEWSWTLEPKKTGESTIRVSISVAWTPKPGIQNIVAIPPTEIWTGNAKTEVNQVLGIISIPNASVAGTVLAVLGIFAQSPNILDIISFVLGFRKDKQATQKTRQRAAKEAEKEIRRRAKSSRRR